MTDDGLEAILAGEADYYRAVLLRVRKMLDELSEKIVDDAERNEDTDLGYIAGALIGLVAGIDDQVPR